MNKEDQETQKYINDLNSQMKDINEWLDKLHGTKTNTWLYQVGSSINND